MFVCDKNPLEMSAKLSDCLLSRIAQVGLEQHLKVIFLSKSLKENDLSILSW